MSMKLYVGNIDFQTSELELEQLFGQSGTVTSANIIADHETGRSRGFGFVEMSSEEEGKSAIADCHGKEINGRSLVVNEARQRENRNTGGKNGGYGGNSRW